MAKEIRTLKFPGDLEPREIVDAKAREQLSQLSEDIADLVPVDEEQIAQVVNEWLDEHPEATTTVKDGSITEDKLHPDLVERLDSVASSAVVDTPYKTQKIGILYDNPEGYDYVAWCPGNLKFDKARNMYVSLVYGSTQHVNGTRALFVAYIDPETYEATAPVQCFTDDGATALSGSTAFWIEDDGTYKMLYAYTDNVTYLFTSTDGGVNWLKGEKVSGFSGSPWGIAKLSNGRLIFGNDNTKVGIYYSDDNGISWANVVPATAGGDYEAEACILELEPGKLIAIARYSVSGIGYDTSGDSEPAIVAFSDDYGTSWTAWKKSETITNMNASSCAGIVHNGMVDIFACSRWYWHGSNSNTDYNNTGKTGAITHYTATVENALKDNFTNNGIVTYANAVGDTSSQDFHSPVLAEHDGEILLMWFDRIHPYTEEKTSHYFARGAVGAINSAPNDNLVSVVYPYSSAMVKKLLDKQYTTLMTKINEIVISGGGTPDVGEDPENPTCYIFDGIVLNLNYLDASKYDSETMTLTDTINSVVGTFTGGYDDINPNRTTATEIPTIRNNSASASVLYFPESTLSQLITDENYELSIELTTYLEDGEYRANSYFHSDANGAGSTKVMGDFISYYYTDTTGNDNYVQIKADLLPNRTGLIHAVLTFSADGTVKGYSDGKEKMNTTAGETFVKWAATTLTRGFWIRGHMKSARIYNRALTADEVLNNYNYELNNII